MAMQKRQEFLDEAQRVATDEMARAVLIWESAHVAGVDPTPHDLLETVQMLRRAVVQGRRAEEEESRWIVIDDTRKASDS